MGGNYDCVSDPQFKLADLPQQRSNQVCRTSRFSTTLRPRHESARLSYQQQRQQQSQKVQQSQEHLWNFGNMNRKRSSTTTIDSSNSKKSRLFRSRFIILALPAIVLVVFIGVSQQYSSRGFLSTLRDTAAIAIEIPAKSAQSNPPSNSISSQSTSKQSPVSTPVSSSNITDKHVQAPITKHEKNDSQLQNETVALKANISNPKTEPPNASTSANKTTLDGKITKHEVQDGNNDTAKATTDNSTVVQNGEEVGIVERNVSIDWRLPLSMRGYEPAQRGSQEASVIGNHSWVQPLILTSIVRRRNESTNETDVYVYATGVMMGNFIEANRNFSMVGCIVGADVYAIDYVAMDVFHCMCNRTVVPGEHVSLVVRNDDAMRKALNEVKRLSLNFVRRLDDGKDVHPLPNNTKFHLDTNGTYNLTNYRQIRTINSSRAKPEVAADLSSQRPRYEVCLLTMMKQFVNLLDDWVDYHRKLGVDQMYILDNDAVEDLSERYANRSDVEVIYWPFQRSQVQAFSLFMVGLRSRCEWLLIWDADEYIMIGIGDKKQDANAQILKKMLWKRRVEGYDEIRFGYITMSPNGHIFTPKEPVPDAYVTIYAGQAVNVKSAMQTDRDWILSRIHYPKGRFWPRILEMEVNTKPVSIDDGSAMVHYQFRSLEEAVLKARYGSSSIGDMNLDFSEVSKVQNMSNPLPLYTDVDERMRYTYFRDIWRAVTNTSFVQTRTVVVWVDGQRCASVFNDPRGVFVKEYCYDRNVIL